MILNEALTYYHNSGPIKNMFLKVKADDRDELKSYIMEILIDQEIKLIKAYKEGWLDYFVWRLIENQYFSNTSPFRRKILWRSYKTSELDFDIEDHKIEDHLSNERFFIQIEGILNGQHWYLSSLFKMHFYKGLSYKEIAEQTGINYQTIRRDILKTLDIIKNKIKYDDDN
jgi:RNA polymerase sigma factor (sigma-70 family)